MVKRLKDPEMKERIKKDIEKQIEEPRELLSTSIITRMYNHTEYSGMYLSEIAKSRNMDIVDCAIELLIEEDGREVGISQQFGSEDDVKGILRHPASMIGSRWLRVPCRS